MSIEIFIFLTQISLDELLDGDDIATCPSCTLRVRVIYDIDSLPNPDDSLSTLEKSETKEDATGSYGSKILPRNRVVV